MDLDKTAIQTDLAAVAGAGVAVKVKTTHERDAPMTSLYITDRGATTKVPMQLIATFNIGKIRSPGTLDIALDRIRAAIIEDRPPTLADEANTPSARNVAAYLAGKK